MGKARLARVHANQGETQVTMEDRKKRNWLAKAKKQLYEKMKEGYDENVAKARAHCLPRWREMTGRGPNESPDYTDPRVDLESFLCDLKVQVLLMEGHRKEVLDMMNDQQR